MRMIKGEIKRFLAGFLAVCMLFSVMPVFYATADGAPQDLYFNFLKLSLRREYGFNTPEAIANASKGTDITTVTDFAMTTKGSVAEINKNADNYGVPTGATDPWCYVGKSTTASMTFLSYDYAMQFNGAVGDWASIKVKVPADGKYEANSVSGYWEHSPIVRIYLAPENAENPRDPKYALNTIDAYPTTGSARFNVDVPLATVDLTAGNYIVSYEMVGKNTNAKNTKFCVSGFKLNVVEEENNISDNIGAHYAYMEKTDENTYKLTVIGGLKDIDGYDEVGFAFTVNGGEEEVKTSKNVYKTITHNGTAITASKLGEDIEYLFYETLEIEETDISSLSFRACLGGEEVEYGSSYVLK